MCGIEKNRMQKTLKDFIGDNTTDPDIEQEYELLPCYYFSLDDALYRYFRTYNDIMGGYHLRIHSDKWNKNVDVDESFSIENITLSLLGFHRYFELFIKDLLRRLDPNLPLKVQNSANLFEAIQNHEMTNTQTIEFGEGFERLKYALKNQKKLNFDFDNIQCQLKDFTFLIDGSNIETLTILNSIRNSIMHFGYKIPNVIASDYFICCRLFPLIYKIIQLDVHDFFKPYYIKTPTGINILDEFLEVKLNYIDFYSDKKEKAFKELMHIAHLKELGRASFNIKDEKRQFGNISSPHYQEYISKYEKIALLEKGNANNVSISSCPCCGNKTLVKTRFNKDSISEIKFALRCSFCDYNINNCIQEPSSYGLTDKNYFE